METAETPFLILNLGVRFEQMGNADAENTIAPLPGKMATLRNGQQQSASVSWSQTTEIVGCRFQTERQKTPPVKILFRNMTSSAIVSETRNSL